MARAAAPAHAERRLRKDTHAAERDHHHHFNNASRKYILRVPDGYDNNHPYRLVFAYAESGASAPGR